MGFFSVRKKSAETKSMLYIYQHTPKTGGSSLKRAIESQYKKNELLYIYDIENRVTQKDFAWYQKYYDDLPNKKKQSLKCILGHSAGGFAGAVHQPFTVFTLLRDPVDRALSLYYYGISLPDDTIYKFARIIKKYNLTLEQIFSDDLKNYIPADDPYSPFNEFFNGQIRSILRPLRHQLRWFENLSGDKNQVQYEQEALDAAFDLIERYYVIGFQEQFNDSIELFAHKFGWKGDLYHRINITTKRLLVNEITSGLKQKIIEHNQLDFALYQNAFAKFQDKIRNIPKK